MKDPGCCGKSKAFAKSSLGHDASVQDEVPLGPHSDQFKQCHDCPCIGFFGLYWVRQQPFRDRVALQMSARPQGRTAPAAMGTQTVS